MLPPTSTALSALHWRRFPPQDPLPRTLTAMIQCNVQERALCPARRLRIARRLAESDPRCRAHIGESRANGEPGEHRLFAETCHRQTTHPRICVMLGQFGENLLVGHSGNGQTSDRPVPTALRELGEAPFVSQCRCRCPTNDRVGIVGGDLEQECLVCKLPDGRFADVQPKRLGRQLSQPVLVGDFSNAGGAGMSFHRVARAPHHERVLGPPLRPGTRSLPPTSPPRQVQEPDELRQRFECHSRRSSQDRAEPRITRFRSPAGCYRGDCDHR
jgi:hypothetical protein